MNTRCSSARPNCPPRGSARDRFVSAPATPTAEKVETAVRPVGRWKLGRHQRKHFEPPGTAAEQVGQAAFQLAGARPAENELQPPVLDQPVHLVENARNLLHLVEDDRAFQFRRRLPGRQIERQEPPPSLHHSGAYCILVKPEWSGVGVSQLVNRVEFRRRLPFRSYRAAGCVWTTLLSPRDCSGEGAAAHGATQPRTRRARASKP